MFSKYFFILIFNVYVCLATKPIIYNPGLDSNREIILKENDQLEILCKGYNDLILLFPRNLKTKIPSSPVEIDLVDEGATKTKSLKRSKTVYGDTGWYGCVDTSNKNHVLRNLDNIYMTPYNYNESDVEWIYVYVQSTTHYFVESEDKVKNLDDPSQGLSFVNYVIIHDYFSVVPGEIVVFPYRPSSPTLNVTLFKNNEEVKLGGRITYDPKRGFIIENSNSEDSGDYTCLINGAHQIEFVLYVTEKTLSMQPYVYDFQSKYDEINKKLEMKCSIAIGNDIFYELYWKTPHESDRISTSINTNNLTNNTFLQWTDNKLAIENFNDEDQGVYECRLYKDSEIHSRFINVYLNNSGGVNFEHLDSLNLTIDDVPDNFKNATTVEFNPNNEAGYFTTENILEIKKEKVIGKNTNEKNFSTENFYDPTPEKIRSKNEIHVFDDSYVSTERKSKQNENHYDTTENSENLIPENVKPYLEKMINKRVEEYVKKNVDPQLGWLKSLKSNLKNLLNLFMQ